jgi:hypothetical protein
MVDVYLLEYISLRIWSISFHSLYVLLFLAFSLNFLFGLHLDVST